MLREYACLVVATALSAGPAWARPAPPAAPPAVIAPAVPAFKMGAMVVDRSGMRLGPIKSLAEGARGPMVVIEIDGKLVAVRQSTLALRGEGAVSAQTKAEILAAASAPP